MKEPSKWYIFWERIINKKLWCKIGIHNYVADMTKYYNDNDVLDFSIHPKDEDIFCERCGHRLKGDNR